MFDEAGGDNFEKKNQMRSSELSQNLRAQIASIGKTVRTEFALLPEPVLNWKQSPQSWSILECIEHLNFYCRYYNPRLRKAMDLALAKNVPVAPHQPGWLGQKFISMMHPDNNKKQTTFKRMNPSGSSLDKSVLEKFLAYQSDLDAIVGDAASVDLNSTFVPVEFLRLLKMNAGDALMFVVVHEQRHIRQAKNVLAIVPTQETHLIV